MATRLSEIYAGRSREEVLAHAKRMLVVQLASRRPERQEYYIAARCHPVATDLGTFPYVMWADDYMSDSNPTGYERIIVRPIPGCGYTMKELHARRLT